MLNKFISKNKFNDIIFRLLIVIFANIILQIATMWFLEPAALYSGGATGLAQLIVRFIEAVNWYLPFSQYNYNLALVIFIVNIPFLVIGSKYVSNKFALYSFIAVVVQILISIFVPSSTSPFQDADVVSLALFGGLLSGFAAGVALKFGTSTGGIDIVAQAFALNKGISIGMFTLTANILIAVIGGGYVQGDWIITLYTCLRMIINSLVMDKIHTAYTYSALKIFTSNDEAISMTIIKQLNRGCTVMNVTGEYTHEERKEIYCVVSTYEVDKVMSIVKENDSKAFVTITPVRKIVGNFVKKTIM